MTQICGFSTKKKPQRNGTVIIRSIIIVDIVPNFPPIYEAHHNWFVRWLPRTKAFISSAARGNASNTRDL